MGGTASGCSAFYRFCSIDSGQPVVYTEKEISRRRKDKGDSGNLNETPRGDRIHIALFGRRNAGKSSIVNALTGQELAIVSDVKGTTTDPVFKAMELLPLGPVVMIDTPGLDDEGELGEKRVKKAKEVLRKTDIALVIADAETGITEFEQGILDLIRERKLPYLIVYRQNDLAGRVRAEDNDHACFVSAVTKEGIFGLKEAIGKLLPEEEQPREIVGDLDLAGETL